MKLLNIFKKRTKNSAKSNIQVVEKKQLSKVIGGIDSSESTEGKAIKFGQGLSK